jgi:hypothetical protein
MHITRVGPDDRFAIRRFVDLPFRLYRENESWVPPLVVDKKSLLRRRHPFCEHSDAEFFLAENDGSALGPIAVLEHRNYKRHHGTRSAFLYFFDSIDDAAAACALFGAAFEWPRGSPSGQTTSPATWTSPRSPTNASTVWRDSSRPAANSPRVPSGARPNCAKSAARSSAYGPRPSRTIPTTSPRRRPRSP